MKYLLSFVLAISVFAVGNAQTFQWNTKSAEAHPKEINPNDPARMAYEKAYNERQIGMAGTYNANAQGQRTAYNETYVNKQLTASHALLPLGTLVRVQNLDNNRFVSVRINDKGQECSDCLLMLSQAAAKQLGISYRGRVSVERTGFSNWNPAPPPTAPVAYGAQAPVTRPVQINNNQWQARGGNAQAPASYGSQAQSPVAYGNAGSTAPNSTYNRPSAYGSQSPQQSDNYAVLNAPNTPSVVSREVPPATVSRQPATYSRYPTASAQTYNQPRVYQPAPSAYNTPAPVYQQPAPVQQQPAPATRQASPPPSTVKRYQESKIVPAPATYQTPTAYNAPQAYSPPPNTQARGVAVPAATAPAATSARQYVVQLGAYNNEAYAKARVDQLQKMGLSNVFYRSIQKSDGQMINRVYAGTFASMAEAQQAGKLIRGNFQIAGIASAL